MFPAGQVVHADVEIMDVYATLLDLAGIKRDARSSRGPRLVPLARDEVGRSPRAALTVDGQVARGLKVQRYRLVHRGPGRIELYDEYDDPREQKDVAADRPIALRGMRGVLGLLYAYETHLVEDALGHRRQRERGVLRQRRAARPPRRRADIGRPEVSKAGRRPGQITGCNPLLRIHVRRVNSEDFEALSEEDQMAAAPESGSRPVAQRTPGRTATPTRLTRGRRSTTRPRRTSCSHSAAGHRCYVQLLSGS